MSEPMPSEAPSHGREVIQAGLQEAFGIAAARKVYNQSLERGEPKPKAAVRAGIAGVSSVMFPELTDIAINRGPKEPSDTPITDAMLGTVAVGGVAVMDVGTFGAVPAGMIDNVHQYAQYLTDWVAANGNWYDTVQKIHELQGLPSAIIGGAIGLKVARNIVSGIIRAEGKIAQKKD